MRPMPTPTHEPARPGLQPTPQRGAAEAVWHLDRPSRRLHGLPVHTVLSARQAPRRPAACRSENLAGSDNRGATGLASTGCARAVCLPSHGLHGCAIKPAAFTPIPSRGYERPSYIMPAIMRSRHAPQSHALGAAHRLSGRYAPRIIGTMQNGRRGELRPP